MTVHITPLPEPIAPEAPGGGLGALSTDKGNLPLDSVDVHASITGLAAGIEVVQGFRNPFDVPLEATYVFPLPNRAAVTRLRMEAGDRVIEGRLKERGQAREDYDNAIAAGQRAAIAEEERPDVFTMRVGNILPGERVTIRLTLNQPLPYEDGGATFRFPLVVAPRYIPGDPLDDAQAGDGVQSDTDAVPDASRISPPVLLPGFPNPVRLSIGVDIDPAGLPLSEIKSALHVVAEESAEAGGKTTVRLQPGERLNRDFILRLAYAPQETAALALTPDAQGEEEGEGTFTLTVLPAGETRPQPRDVVLILDRSGSMHGWKMVAARRAAARIIDTLTADDRFAVLAFDNTIERPRDLGTGLVAGTDRNRFRAVEHLAAMDARGGTEMLSPLTEAAALLADSTADRVLVLITDGQVGNEDQILAHLVPRLQGVRVHTVGIDRAVNAGFLRRLAADGQGRCELVESEDRLDEAMDNIHHRIGSPIATNLSLHPEGLEIVPDTVAPRRLGALFPGVPLVISGRFRGAPSAGAAAAAVVVRGDESWEQRAAGVAAEDRANAAVWARAHLRDLEDQYAVDGGEELERRIVATSLKFGVLCRFTSFVAVDTRVVTEGGTSHKVVQPVEMPQGWGDAPVDAARPMMATQQMGYDTFSVKSVRGRSRAAMPPPGGGYGMAPRPAPAPPSAPPPPAAPSAPSAQSGPPPAAPSGPPPSTPTGPPSPPRPGPRPASRPPLQPDADELDVPDFLRGDSASAESAESAEPESYKILPAPGIETAAETLAQVRRELGQEFQRLTQFAAGDTLQARAQKLRDLLDKLEPMVMRLERVGADAALVAPLRGLVTELQAVRSGEGGEPPNLERLWGQTTQVLADFVGAGGQSQRGSKRAFWKRGS
ncbi:VWA domain-containing protein [Actinomadura barringtoniae]|uniref:VWA domain-containing protein n=1 Tax=Actinomadura barringtoniae TaxID=1427535 RepID=A0A939T672_9ACTN|nr:VIT domain-containing protein [Actinomadura barringtoniae]MBO2451568.1 VWA domain-containing protein [Actinomadura barringtoniae]